MADTLVAPCRAPTPPGRCAAPSSGLGMIGRHHARLLQASPGVRLRRRRRPRRRPLRRGARPGARVRRRSTRCCAPAPPDFAIVAVPTEEHVAAVRDLAAAGVHVLDREAARGDRRRGPRASSTLCGAAGMHAAVGHVERFNPALLELRRRDAGRPARRGLPHRHRARRAVPGPRARRRRRQGPRHARPRPRPLARRRARSSAWPRRPSTGWAASTRTSCSSPAALESDVSFNTRRRLAVADEGPPARACSASAGMLVADTLTADLTFYANGDDGVAMGARRRRCAASREGDATRYALARREPLLVELEAFLRPARRRPRRARGHARRGPRGGRAYAEAVARERARRRDRAPRSRRPG